MQEFTEEQKKDIAETWKQLREIESMRIEKNELEKLKVSLQKENDNLELQIKEQIVELEKIKIEKKKEQERQNDRLNKKNADLLELNKQNEKRLKEIQNREIEIREQKKLLRK